MWKRSVALLIALALLSSLSACRPDSNTRAENLHYLDIYKHGILSQEEKDHRAEVRQTVSDVLPSEMPEHRVSFKGNRIEVTVSAFDNIVNTAPDDWKGTVETSQKASTNLYTALQGKGGLPVVLYLADARKILLTTRNGELLYDRFGKTTKKEVREVETFVDLQAIEDLAAEINDRLDSNLETPSYNVVYVSTRSNTIHSIPDCSGMKNYRTMSQEDADAMGYKYCQNCW